MTQVLTPDICVIGGGAAGLSIAAAAAAFGRPVVLVEQGKMGGEWLNTGSVPSKALLATARRFAQIKEDGVFGIDAGAAKIDFAKVREHIRSVIAAIAPNVSAARFTGLGITVIQGAARFTDADTLSAGDTTIKAKNFVIATGSLPAMPMIPGLDGAQALTNETIFDLAECPKHLVVIGGGSVGMELAQAFRRLGSQATVIEPERVLRDDDPECVDAVLAQFAREGIDVYANTSIRNVSCSGGSIQLKLETPEGEKTVEGTHLLVTTGRRANIDSLDLARAGIKFNADGVIVDKRLRTTNKKVYVIGDAAAGSPRLAHAASYHAGLVIRSALFNMRAKVDPDTIPRMTFTQPELAHIGLTDIQAAKKYKHIRVLRWPFHDNDRAQIERNAGGHVKIVTDADGTVLGATIVGAHAGELIATWTLAVTQRLNIAAIAETVAPYPTLAEAGKRAAITYFTPGLKRPLVRRIISFLRRR